MNLFAFRCAHKCFHVFPTSTFAFSFYNSFYINQMVGLYFWGMQSILIYMTCHLDQPTATAYQKSYSATFTTNLIFCPQNQCLYGQNMSTVRFTIKICPLLYAFSHEEECIQIYNSSHFPIEFTCNKVLFIDAPFSFTLVISQLNYSSNFSLDL